MSTWCHLELKSLPKDDELLRFLGHMFKKNIVLDLFGHVLRELMTSFSYKHN